jgi:hypothetical protein
VIPVTWIKRARNEISQFSVKKTWVASFEVFTAMLSRIPLFWDMILRRWASCSQCFEVTYCLTLEDEGSAFLWSVSVTTHPPIDRHIPGDLNPQSFSYKKISFRRTGFWFPLKWDGGLIPEYITVVSLWKIAAGKYHHEMSTQKQILRKSNFTSQTKPVAYISAVSTCTPLELQEYEYDIYY